MLERSFRLEAY